VLPQLATIGQDDIVWDPSSSIQSTEKY